MSKRVTYYALQTPSGIIVPAGTEKPELSKEDKLDFWKVIRIKSILGARKERKDASK